MDFPSAGPEHEEDKKHTGFFSETRFTTPSECAHTHNIQRVLQTKTAADAY